MTLGLSVHASQIEALVINQGFTALLQSYGIAPQYYDGFASVERADFATLAAAHGDFPYGYKQGTILGMELPKEIEFGQAIPADTMVSDFAPQFKVRKLARSVTFAKEDFQKRNGMSDIGDKVVMLADQWGRSFGAMKNQIVADILQKGTLSAGHPGTFKNSYAGRLTTDGKIYDGVSFFNSAHPERSGSSTTYSNINASLAFSSANLQSVNQIMRYTNALDGRGNRVDILPDVLVVPPVLEFDAAQVLNSTLLPGTTNNDINPLLGRMRIVVNPYLSDDAAAAATAGWFVGASGVGGIKVLDTGAPVLEVSEDASTQTVTVTAVSYFGAGVTDWRGWYAANKATS